ncbi:hypothetical protein AWC18_07380 [Mycolicibacter nonchromogenicus]|uniref:Uncharacterized protein n=1 Tax=Mycolicibacter nonchromogenicus TaxID=1782 RepID=A0A1X1ZGX3_MYCNO|nr:hypothetical protein [Mycolicibacter nonchromogenicus]ORW22589.1 hypothetical protein AWC18_07380 [Mycolicibacter nonchromogenicus]
MRYLLLLIAPVLFGLGLGVPSTAGADASPPCAAFDTCRYMPNPYYDGPLMPTWNLPGVYGGQTTLPAMCDPASYSCRTYVPGTR